MTNGRDFEWPQTAVDTANEMVFRYATVHEVMQYLLVHVKDALAAEYDRGYETALDMEIKAAQRDAWYEGFGVGTHPGGVSENPYE